MTCSSSNPWAVIWAVLLDRYSHGILDSTCQFVWEGEAVPAWGSQSSSSMPNHLPGSSCTSRSCLIFPLQLVIWYRPDSQRLALWLCSKTESGPNTCLRRSRWQSCFQCKCDMLYSKRLEAIYTSLCRQVQHMGSSLTILCEKHSSNCPHILFPCGKLLPPISKRGEVIHRETWQRWTYTGRTWWRHGFMKIEGQKRHSSNHGSAEYCFVASANWQWTKTVIHFRIFR